jgi:signal transduction histidine kinase
VLENLFSNAVKYSRRGSEARFSFRREPDRLVFSVTDTGLGIPAEEIPKLFQEFGKTSVRPTEGEQSTGLGLAIAKRIVEQHKGQIMVESKPGPGSTFTFWIPSIVPQFRL